MDYHWSLAGKCIVEYEMQHYIQYSSHMIQCMDSYSYDWYKPNLLDNLNLRYILVDSLAIYRYKMVNKNILLDYSGYGIGSLDRKVNEYMDL